MAGILLPGAAQAQGAGTSVSGQVVAVVSRPIPGAVVHLEGVGVTVRTDRDGRFVLPDVRAGDYVVTIAAAGYTTLARRFEVAAGAGVGAGPGAVDLGVVTLQATATPTVILFGTVRDSRSGQGIGDVPIRVNSRVIGLSNADGGYRIVSSTIPVGKSSRLRIERSGYQTVDREFTVPEGERTLALDLVMEPLADAAGTGGNVSEPQASHWLAGFERRRRQGVGSFFTQAEIRALGAASVSDVLRRVPGAIVITEDATASEAASGRTEIADRAAATVTFQSVGRRADGEPCRPLLFINRLLIRTPDLDQIFQARDLAGIEVYAPGLELPPEFDRPDAECGVVALWIESLPRRSPGRAVGFEVGAHVSARWRAGASKREQVGVQMLQPLVGPVEFRPSFGLIVEGDAQIEGGWQAMANVVVHPLQKWEPWYAGIGVSATTLRLRSDTPELHVSHVLVTGAAVPLGPIRPFFEVQLLDVARADREWHTVMGLTVRTHRAPPPRYTVVER